MDPKQVHLVPNARNFMELNYVCIKPQLTIHLLLATTVNVGFSTHVYSVISKKVCLQTLKFNVQR